MNNHVELGKEFRPAGLPTGKKFSSGEVFQIFVISDHINWGSATFEVLPPVFEGFKYSEKFLIMGVIVELCGIE